MVFARYGHICLIFALVLRIIAVFTVDISTNQSNIDVSYIKRSAVMTLIIGMLQENVWPLFGMLMHGFIMVMK